MKPTTHFQHFPFLDDLEVLRADRYRADFPLQAHPRASLTLVRSGCETTRVADRELTTPRRVAVLPCQLAFAISF